MKTLARTHVEKDFTRLFRRGNFGLTDPDLVAMLRECPGDMVLLYATREEYETLKKQYDIDTSTVDF